MKTLTHDQLREFARRANRPKGYIADVLRHAADVTDEEATWTDEAWAKLRAKYGPVPGAGTRIIRRGTPARPASVPAKAKAPIQPIPRDQWPMAARVLARLAKPGDTGLGDVVKRLASMVGGEQYKRLAKRLGMDCGCAGRQAQMNAKYPLG